MWKLLLKHLNKSVVSSHFYVTEASYPSPIILIIIAVSSFLFRGD